MLFLGVKKSLIAVIFMIGLLMKMNALDTYENAFQLPIEKLMLYVIAITGLSGRNKIAHYSIFSDIEEILSLNSLDDLIMDLEDVEKDEFLRDLNIVMNNKLI